MYIITVPAIEPSEAWLLIAAKYSIAAIVTLLIIITIGLRKAITLWAEICDWLKFSFTTSNLFCSSISVTKDFTSLAPLIVSPNLVFKLSILLCIALNLGVAFLNSNTTPIDRIGTHTNTTVNKSAEVIYAIIIAPIKVIGALSIILKLITSTCWTCVVSFVTIVSNLPAVILSIFACEKDCIFANNSSRKSYAIPVDMYCAATLFANVTNNAKTAITITKIPIL